MHRAEIARTCQQAVHRACSGSARGTYLCPSAGKSEQSGRCVDIGLLHTPRMRRACRIGGSSRTWEPRKGGLAGRRAPREVFEQDFTIARGERIGKYTARNERAPVECHLGATRRIQFA